MPWWHDALLDEAGDVAVTRLGNKYNVDVIGGHKFPLVAFDEDLSLSSKLEMAVNISNDVGFPHMFEHGGERFTVSVTRETIADEPPLKRPYQID